MAQGYGVGFWAVAEWGYHEFLIAQAGLEAVERVEGIRQRERALHGAEMVCHAMWDPKQLDQERRDIRRLLRIGPHLEAEAEAKMTEILAFEERVERRRRRGS